MARPKVLQGLQMTTYTLPDQRLVIAQQCEIVSLFPNLPIDAWHSPPAFGFGTNDGNTELIDPGTRGTVLGFHGTGHTAMHSELPPAKMGKAESEKIVAVQVLLDDGRCFWFASRNVRASE